MYHITRCTTPTIEIMVNMDLTGYTCWLSFGQNGRSILTKKTHESKCRDHKSIISFTLTQEESKSLPVGRTKIQMRAAKGDEAIATRTIDIEVLDVIDEDAI